MQTKLQIIRRLWSVIYDLLAYIKSDDSKNIREIEKEIDLLEYDCRPYADCDDDELYADELARTVKAILAERK